MENTDKLSITMAGEIAMSKEAGKSMRKWREIFQINQTELAGYLGVSSSTISDYEGGRRKSPGISVIKRFIEALIKIDMNKDGATIRCLSEDMTSKAPFEIHEFYGPVNGEHFVENISGRVIINRNALKNSTIYGYTIIDSIKAILEVPIDSFIKIFGATSKRALIFTNVTSGRSPMIALRISGFSMKLKPALVVMHGIDEIDPLALKIAEVEKIPLVISKIKQSEISSNLKKYESYKK
ncbi:MAG: helix-turn-helix domain-containing protein [Candidatus Diapherotrites archaeon]|nr:helix-turn-helix domain-containing protein [Candidatus Diapherotrites archaeon]